MLDELSYLIKLQEHDSAVDEIAQRASALDPKIKAKSAELDALRNNLKSSKDALSTHQLKKKQLEGEQEAKEKENQKRQGELNSLKSNDAYKAMLSEIEAGKQAVVKIEDQILEVMEAMDRSDKEYKEREKKFKADEAVMKGEVQKLEGEKAVILEEANKKKAERDKYAKTVPPAIFQQYEAIRDKRGGVAIVPMVNNSCSGCRMTLTPNKANEVKKAKTMVLCDNCTRILYLPRENQPSAPAPADNPTSVST